MFQLCKDIGEVKKGYKMTLIRIKSEHHQQFVTLVTESNIIITRMFHLETTCYAVNIFPLIY